MLLDDLGDQRVPGGLIGHVQMVVRGGVADPRRGLLTVLIEHIGDDHLCAFRGEELSFCRALPSRAAGDQRHLVCQSVDHDSAPSVWLVGCAV